MPDTVDVTLDVVPAERIPCSQRRLDVDAVPAASAPERRARDRLRDSVERELVPATAVAVRQQPSSATESPTAQPEAVTGACTTSERPPSASATETTTPTSRTIPVNTR